MRRYTFPFGLIFLFFLMLSFPQAVFHGASEGLLLWFQIVLPTLLPFVVLSNLLIHTNSISVLSRILGPFFQKIFHTSSHGSFAVLAGFLCGYPVGAKVTSELLLAERITKQEGRYLLSFCNNTSPMFIVSYIVWQTLKDSTLLFPTVFILFLSPILCSFFFRNIRKKKSQEKTIPINTQSLSIRFNFELFDICIMDGFETITKIGGYIILFSILVSLFQLLPIQSAFFQNILLPMLEITNGIPMLAKSALSDTQKYVLILSLTSFGGWCSIAQTKSIIQHCDLPIIPYILEKLATALVTSFLAFLYITFIHS